MTLCHPEPQKNVSGIYLQDIKLSTYSYLVEDLRLGLWTFITSAFYQSFTLASWSKFLSTGERLAVLRLRRLPHLQQRAMPTSSSFFMQIKCICCGFFFSFLYSLLNMLLWLCTLCIHSIICLGFLPHIPRTLLFIQLHSTWSPRLELNPFYKKTFGLVPVFCHLLKQLMLQ